MKIKYLGQKKWMKSYRSQVKKATIQGITGYVSMINVDELAEPIEIGGKILADSHFTAISFMPIEDFWCLQAFYDADGNLIEWYIDINLENTVDSDGNPYYTDLYLDVVVYPDGEVKIIDEDELIEAFQAGIIDEKQMKHAYDVCDDVIKNYTNKEALTKKCNEIFKNFNMINGGINE